MYGYEIHDTVRTVSMVSQSQSECLAKKVMLKGLAPEEISSQYRIIATVTWLLARMVLLHCSKNEVAKNKQIR
jgi:hypothetical protein